jgi:hypothetical protein
MSYSSLSNMGPGCYTFNKKLERLGLKGLNHLIKWVKL